MQQNGSKNFYRRSLILPLIALSALTFSTSCGRIDERLNAAGTRIGQVRAAEVPGPTLPQDCRETETVGLTGGESLFEAVGLYDIALAAQNARTRRCADWHDKNFGEEAAGPQ